MNKYLHRYALVTAFFTFFLIIAGGMVTSTGSGLAVPDWPLSYGQLMPPMVGGIFYEHGHRMVATFVGFLTVILAVWLWKAERRKWVKWLGVIALGAVLLQGALGGLTVIFLLPTVISVSHAALAQSFFCLVASIALFTSPWWEKNDGGGYGEQQGRKLFRITVVMVGVVFIQLLLGAIMRHTESGLAVPDFPLAFGAIFPPLSADALERYNRILLDSHIRIAADGPVTAFQVLIHLAHRLWAIVVLITAVGVVVVLRQSAVARTRMLSKGILILVLAQATLGAFTVLTRKDELVATAHVAFGALTLVASVLLALHVARLAGITFHRRGPAPVGSEALA